MGAATVITLSLVNDVAQIAIPAETAGANIIIVVVVVVTAIAVAVIPLIREENVDKIEGIIAAVKGTLIGAVTTQVGIAEAATAEAPCDAVAAETTAVTVGVAVVVVVTAIVTVDGASDDHAQNS